MRCWSGMELILGTLIVYVGMECLIFPLQIQVIILKSITYDLLIFTNRILWESDLFHPTSEVWRVLCSGM